VALVFASLPSQGAGQLAAQTDNNNRIQSRATTPHKNLPSPKDVLDEGRGVKEKAQAKETPLKPPTLCRYRDVACLAAQRKNGGKISFKAAPTASPEQAQVASAAPKTEGNWFQRLGKKIASAWSGTSASVSSSQVGHSLLPSTTITPTAVPAPPPPPTFSTLNEAKLDPHNRIGTGGEDLFSGNYHWSTPLVSLPGRNGLDLNLSLHYNSLQWVRYSNTMYYEPDWRVSLPSGMTPGFYLGLPVIESGYSYDGETAYAVTMPSGYRVPMRRVYVSGSTAKYEATDGSYLYLSVVGSSAPILSAPDGTQYTYGWNSGNGTRNCTQVRDRNGNRLNLTYNSTFLTSITDTLGRVLTFNYSGYHLMTITQNWLGTTKVLAQFDYGTVSLNYTFQAGLTIDGPASGTQISVLTRVITSDGARHVFVYNGWGIVDDIFVYGASDNQRAATDYAFPAPSAALSDGPRFSQRNDGIWGFSGQWNSNLGWVANYFQFDANEDWGQVTTPDGVVQKELFSDSGSTRGLSTGMETIVSGVKRKWTATSWASDGTSYPRYPRVTETNIYDDADGNGTADNRRRTMLEYWTFTAGGTMPYTVYLPKKTLEYAADAATVYRRAETDYLNDAEYWSRWMVGLPSEQRLLDGGGTLQAKTTYLYDWTQIFTHPTSISQHDTGSFGPSFYWRGNRTMTRRYSVVNGVAGSYTETQADYNVTGTLAKTRDALSHETEFFYDDAFATYADDTNDTETLYNAATKTWAYPTQVQDADNYSMFMKYWYDTGAVTKTTDPKGAANISLYETTFGRLAKAKNLVNGAYTRYVGHNWLQTWTTVNSTSEETAVLSLLDGASRERQHVDEHPGSAGTLSSWYRIYDLMGRVIEQSNPTEISSVSWAPTGDDAAYVYTRQDYDWQHRPTVTYNQDYNASTNPNSKRTISYTGCGCAGGLVTTVTDEMGRAQKSYTDFLGRTYKTEVMNGASVYSSAQTTFNVRDQVTNLTEYAGAVGSGGASQETVMTYDGYGRLWTRKRPQETTATTYSYYANDQIMAATDARGATGTLTYNARGLLTQAIYSVPAGVAATPTVTFQYDAAGNRTVMDDGPGQVTYNYDTLSRITNETRTLDSLPGQSFQLQYEYNLSGQVTKLTDPTNAYINYAYDKTGRTTGITGSAFGGVTQYATGIAYRAWNGPKTASYGSGFAATVKYTPRLQVKEFDLPGVIGGTYTYNLDGQLNTFTPSTPQSSDYDWRMGRTFTYDAIGRMSGSAASGGGNFPFAYNPTYNEFGNITNSSYLYWQGGASAVTFSATYQNNRATAVTDAGQTQTWTYDAMGNRTSLVQNGNTIENILVNAVGRAANEQTDGTGQPIKMSSDYYIRSTVMGGAIITQVDYAGVKKIGRVLDGNNLIATQIVSASGNTVSWQHRDPLNLVARNTEPGQVKRRTFAINPVGAQIETTDGVNLTQYYACFYGGQNNPSCTGYTPQPAGGYGSYADQSMGAFVAGIKVDGALTLGSVEDVLRWANRVGASVSVSPAVAGTALGLNFQRIVYEEFVPGPGKTPGEREKNGDVRFLDAWMFVPGGANDGPNKSITVETAKSELRDTLAGIKSNKCRTLLGIFDAELSGPNNYIDNILKIADQTHPDFPKKPDGSLDNSFVAFAPPNNKNTILLGALWNDKNALNGDDGKTYKAFSYGGRYLAQKVILVHEYTHARYYKGHLDIGKIWIQRDKEFNLGILKHYAKFDPNDSDSISETMNNIITDCIIGASAHVKD
jgi:YD repeat-containing protein